MLEPLVDAQFWLTVQMDGCLAYGGLSHSGAVVRLHVAVGEVPKWAGDAVQRHDEFGTSRAQHRTLLLTKETQSRNKTLQLGRATTLTPEAEFRSTRSTALTS